MANDKTPKDNQENPVSQVEESQVNSEQEDEAEGLGKLYEENKTMIFGILAIGIAVGVFLFMSIADELDDVAIAKDESAQAEVDKLFEEKTHQG